MKYTVITDSCCDLFAKDLNSDKIDFHVVPLTLITGDEEFVDTEDLDTRMFVDKMNSYKGAAKSACPSPEAFAEAMRSGDNVICITLSSKLSGTHASAMVAAEMVKKESPDKKLFVLDSLSAAAGSVHILLRLKELIESGKYSYDEITVKISEISSKTRVRFLLMDLGNLIKNGRMGKVVGTILNTAKIKLVCGENGEGEIKKFGLALGMRKGLQSMAELPGRELAANADREDTPITITHVHNEEDASFLKGVLESKFGFKNITTRLMRGLSSLYAADKGIVIAYTTA